MLDPYSRRLMRTVLPILVLGMAMTACGGSIAETVVPSTTFAASKTSTSLDPVAACGSADATVDADGNCIVPSPTTTTGSSPDDLAAQIAADCEYNGDNPCPEVNADNVQAALTTWICPNLQLTLTDTHGDESKARSLLQVLLNSGQEKLIVNARLAETALDEHLCPVSGS